MLFAALRIVVPSGTLTTFPSMVTFAMVSVSEPVPEQALLLLDVPVELLPELPDERLGGHRRRVRQRTDGPAHHVVAQVEDQLDVARPALPLLDAPDELLQPPRPLAARRALAARLVGVEVHEDGERP